MREDESTDLAGDQGVDDGNWIDHEAVKPPPVGARLGLWFAVLAGVSFVTGLLGVLFSTSVAWEESFTPPSCIELVDSIGAGWAGLAFLAGPVLTAVAGVGVASKKAAAGRHAVGMAFSSRLTGVAAVVILAAPVLAYSVVDLGYRLGIRGNFEIADVDTCVGQLIPGPVALSLVVVIVAGAFALGRTLVRY